jgi:leucyl-tRNA synthetase
LPRDDDSPKPKSYVLEMFPYPSGRIHMGHVRNYTMGDVLARFRRMTGHEVLHPMGWDAFGMPAENAAMEKGPSRQLDPRQHRDDEGAAEAAGLRARLDARAGDLRARILRARAGAVPRSVARTGLVYRKESAVNWDPVDMTVLANEQVIDGRGWRSGALVERRKLSQWFLKITQFADELLDGVQGARALARQGQADAGELDRQVARGCSSGSH